MQNVLASAVWVSLYVSASATCISAAIGIPIACRLSMTSFRGKRIVMGALNTLLAVPTVVVGLLVYSMLCRRSLFGDLGLLYTPGAMIIGQALLALPLMTVFAHTALAGVDRTAVETARMLGARRQGLVRMMIVEARLGILAAIAAAFGRLIGEVGVSMIVGGNIAGYTRTMTTSIALETSKGEFSQGLLLGGILLAVALTVNIVLQFLRSPATKRGS